MVAFHSSQMYSKNITNFLSLMVKDGKMEFDTEDEVISGSLVTDNGEIVNSNIKEAVG